VQRQAAGMVLFRFKKVTKAIPQRNSDGVDMRSSNKDEDLQNNDGGSNHSGEEANLSQSPGNTAGNLNGVGLLLKCDVLVLMSLKF
jgi:hypothetical protein